MDKQSKQLAAPRFGGRWYDRFTERPPWLRAVILRRIVSLALIAGAAFLVATSNARTETVDVVTAAHHLKPGMELTAADLTVTGLPPSAKPPGALHKPEDAIGMRVTGAVAGGEVLTRTRLLTPQLPAALAGGPDARIVPVRPSDPSVIALLRPGDLVDVIDESGTVLAQNSVVVTVTEQAKPASRDAGPVLLAMSASQSHHVAASGLRESLAVILH